MTQEQEKNSSPLFITENLTKRTFPIIHTLIFDLDGTLVDTKKDLARAVNHALKSIDRPQMSDKAIIHDVGDGLRALLNRVLGPVEDPVIEKARESFMEFYADHCVDYSKPYPGVRKTLKKFKGHIKMAVVTNKQHKFAVPILSKLGLREYLDVIFGGDSWPEAKPSSLPIRKALHLLDADSHTAMVVGDGIQDMKAGQEAKVRTCLARYGFGFRPALLELKPDFVIRRFMELKEICG